MSTSVKVLSYSLVGNTKLTQRRGAPQILPHRQPEELKGLNCNYTFRRGTLLIYTEPLFFWDENHRCFIRYLDVNDESSSIDGQSIRTHIPKDHPARRLKPCFHYQASGETQAQRIIRKWFEDQSCRITVKVSRECIEREVWDHNLVLLGNARTNKYLRHLQESLTFTLAKDSIKAKAHGYKRAKQYVDLRPPKLTSSEQFVHAIVTRRPSRAAQRCATVIAANHGRAMEKLAEYLTAAHSLEQLYQQLNISAGKPLPARFQLLFRVQTIDFELASGEPELIDFVLEPDRAKAKKTS